MLRGRGCVSCGRLAAGCQPIRSPRAAGVLLTLPTPLPWPTAAAAAAGDSLRPGERGLGGQDLPHFGRRRHHHPRARGRGRRRRRRHGRHGRLLSAPCWLLACIGGGATGCHAAHWQRAPRCRRRCCCCWSCGPPTSLTRHLILARPPPLAPVSPSHAAGDSSSTAACFSRSIYYTHLHHRIHSCTCCGDFAFV